MNGTSKHLTSVPLTVTRGGMVYQDLYNMAGKLAVTSPSLATFTDEVPASGMRGSLLPGPRTRSHHRRE